MCQLGELLGVDEEVDDCCIEMEVMEFLVSTVENHLAMCNCCPSNSMVRCGGRSFSVVDGDRIKR